MGVVCEEHEVEVTVAVTGEAFVLEFLVMVAAAVVRAMELVDVARVAAAVPRHSVAVSGLPKVQMEADLVVLDSRATPHMKLRMETVESLVNELSLLQTCGDDRAAVLGTWLQRPRLANRYVYCANDPVNRLDPSGHWSFGGVLLTLLGVAVVLPRAQRRLGDLELIVDEDFGRPLDVAALGHELHQGLRDLLGRVVDSGHW